jgi:hypothetical protein
MGSGFTEIFPISRIREVEFLHSAGWNRTSEISSVKGFRSMAINDYRHKRFAKDPALTAQEVVDELILIPLKSPGVFENAYVMNEVAGRVWALVNGQRQVQEIGAIVAEEFDVSVEEAESDLILFFKQLEHIGAVWAV